MSRVKGYTYRKSKYPHLYTVFDKDGKVIGHHVDLQLGWKGVRLRRTFIRQDAALQYIADEKNKYQREVASGTIVPGKERFMTLLDQYYTRPNQQRRLAALNRSEASRVSLLKNYFKDKAVSSISEHDIEIYINDREASGIKRSSIQRELNILSPFFKWAKKKKYIHEDPFEGLEKLDFEEPAPRPLTKDEQAKLLSGADDNLKDVILLAINTGFRKSNLRLLMPRDITSTAILARRTKTGKFYAVPIKPAIRLTLAKLLLHNPGDRPVLNTTNLEQGFRYLCDRLGLRKSADDPAKVTLHSLRDTFAQESIDEGVNIYRLAQMMGHSSVKVTEKYYLAAGKNPYTHGDVTAAVAS